MYPQFIFWALYKKISFFFHHENYQFYSCEKSQYIAWACLRNATLNFSLKEHTHSKGPSCSDNSVYQPLNVAVLIVKY